MTTKPMDPAIFIRTLDSAIKDARRARNLLALILIELTWEAEPPPEVVASTLEKISQYLKSLLRRADVAVQVNDNSVGVILPEIIYPSDMLMVAERLFNALVANYKKGEITGKPTITISAADCSSEIRNGTALLELAQANLATTNFRVSNATLAQANQPSSKSTESREKIIEGSLNSAIEKKQFYMVYQPVFELETRVVASWEAFIRWRHPELGEVTAEEFLPFAYKNDLMPAIEDWVMISICKNIKRWLARGLRIKRIYINLRAQQFENPNFATNLKSLLRKFELEPSHLGIDLLNIEAIKNSEVALQQIRSLERSNMTFNLDDFKQELLSLDFFEKIPATSWKLPRAMTENVFTESDQKEIFKELVKMADKKYITITAKGIEKYEHFVLLNQLGSHLGQGFYLCKPLPAVEVTPLIDKSRIYVSHN